LVSATAVGRRGALNGHFNHPAELAADAEETCIRVTPAHPFLPGREGDDAIAESDGNCIYGQPDPL
jgi:hypothetical protein